MRLRALDLKSAKMTVVFYGKRGENGETARTIAFRCTGKSQKQWKVVGQKPLPGLRATTVKFIDQRIDEQDFHWVIVRRGRETVMLYPPDGGFVEIYPDGAQFTCQAELFSESGQPAFLEHRHDSCRQVRFEESALLV